MKYAWIHRHTKRYPICVMCKVLGVSRSGYYDWRARPLSRQAVRREHIRQAARRAHAESKRIYGYRKVHEELLDSGDPELTCCRETVRRVMAECGLRSETKRAFVITTRAAKDAPVAPNLLARDFAADAPDQKWTADITYIATGEGWLYLAIVLDLYSRKVVGWATSARIDTGLVLDALRDALQRRRPTADLVHHSDRGCQYTSDAFREMLEDYGIDCSMSPTGDPWSNAPAESFFASLKTEEVYRTTYATRDVARQATFEYIELFYNRRRRHAALGYKSPVAYEEMWAA